MSVVYDDLPGWEHLNPWLASLFVLPAHRRGGVGGMLVCAAEDLMRKNGIGQGYLFTERSGGFSFVMGGPFWRRLNPTGILSM